MAQGSPAKIKCKGIDQIAIVVKNAYRSQRAFGVECVIQLIPKEDLQCIWFDDNYRLHA